MIEWFSKSQKEMIATIHNTNITINKPGVDALSSAYAAMLGIDENQKVVAIKPLTKDEYDSGLYEKDLMFVLTGGSSYTRVSSSDFVHRLGGVLGTDFSSPRKYSCEYDKDEKLLRIDVREEVR